MPASRPGIRRWIISKTVNIIETGIKYEGKGYCLADSGISAVGFQPRIIRLVDTGQHLNFYLSKTLYLSEISQPLACSHAAGDFRNIAL